MKTSTHTLALNASKADVFAFLSNIENLPKWATVFCKELKTDDHIRYKVVTPEGEIFFRIEADINTGVIDMYGGPAQDKIAYWPWNRAGINQGRIWMNAPVPKILIESTWHGPRS